MLKAICALALSKVLPAAFLKTSRDEVSPGTYEVDFLVRVFGSLKIGEDYEQSITSKVKPLDLWLATLDLLAPHITAALLRRISERAVSGNAGETIRQDATLKAGTEEALALVRSMTVSACKGKITTKLHCEAVEATVYDPADTAVHIVP